MCWDQNSAKSKIITYAHFLLLLLLLFLLLQFMASLWTLFRCQSASFIVRHDYQINNNPFNIDENSSSPFGTANIVKVSRQEKKNTFALLFDQPQQRQQRALQRKRTTDGVSCIWHMHHYCVDICHDADEGGIDGIWQTTVNPPCVWRVNLHPPTDAA